MLLPTMPAPMTTTFARSGSALIRGLLLHVTGPAQGACREMVARARDGRPVELWAATASSDGAAGRNGRRPTKLLVARGPAGRNGALTAPEPGRSFSRLRVRARTEPRPDRAVPSLYIDGQWVASATGECSPVVNPSDATVVTEVDVATDGQVQQAIAAARRAFDRGDWPRHADGRTGGAPRPRRRADRPRSRGAGPARDDQHGQGPAREPLGHDRRRARVPLLRRPGRQGGRPPGRHGQPVGAQPDRPRAGRRLRPDRSMELPAAPAQLEGGTGAGGRQHRGDEAGQPDAALRDPPDAAARRGGRPGRRRQPRPGPGRPGRAGAGGQPGRGPGLADRRARGGAEPAPRCRGQHQAGRARARWQEPQHHLRRRRLRDGRGQRPDRRVHPFRPGLLGRLPGDRPGRDLRPVRRRGRAARGPDPPRCRARTRPPRRARSSPRRIERRSHGTWRSALAEGARLVAGGGAAHRSRSWPRASTSARRSWPTAGAT